MASVLEWLSGVLFDEEQHSSWSAASNDERAQILKDAGLEDLDASDMTEAMQLLAEELPPEQAAAISEAASDSLGSEANGMSALDHFVNQIEPAELDSSSDEFDADLATQDEFEIFDDPSELEVESNIDLEAEVEPPLGESHSDSDTSEEFLTNEDPMDLDYFDGSTSLPPGGEVIEDSDADPIEEFDLGEDPGDF